MSLRGNSFSNNNPETLVDTLVSKKNSEQKIIYCDDLSNEIVSSYAQMYSDSLALLDQLVGKGLSKGDQLIFQFKNNHNFTTTFWACILGGIIPVPISVGEKDENYKKVFSVWDILDDPFICFDSPALFENLKAYSERFGLQGEFTRISNKSLDLSKLPSSDSKNLSKLVCDVQPDDIAFIQFSSGSTGQPKGVVLTHKNLIANVKALASCSEATSRDVMVSWMPLTHDMGLIAVHLTSTLLGIKQVLIDTPIFVRRPFIWMEKTSVHKGTMLFTPNYGLHITLISMERRKFDWDLSSVRVIFNGAEPISLTLADKFLKELKHYKLPYNSMYPVYGLAEASVGVSLPKPGAPMKPHYLDRTRLNFGEKVTSLNSEDPNAITFLEVGTAIDECNIKIADEKGQDIPDSHIGLIHIKGNNVTSGYFKNLDETKRVLRSDGWLNTGDLGFIQDGQLIITGRAKDLIIINGQNIYAHDIEQICTQIPELLLRNVVASSIATQAGSEELLIFVRYKKSPSEFIKLSAELRCLMQAKLGLRIHAVIPVTTIPKTTSGKVRRYKLKERYLNGEFKSRLDEIDVINREQGRHENSEKSRGQINKRLDDLLFTLLGYHVKNGDAKLADHGINSVKAVEFRAALESAFSIDIPVSCIFDYPTVMQLKTYLFEMLNNKDNSAENQNTKIIHKNDQAIAIIGLAGKFPGSQTSNDAFFNNLVNGIDLNVQVPNERWPNDTYYDPGNNPGSIKTKCGYFLEQVDEFDADFFGITPVEAESIDPQQRMLLTVSQHAIDNAGIKNESLNGSKTAVYIGMANSDFSHQVFEQKNSDLLKEHSLTGTMASTAAGRISYCYGLTGPSMTIDTACSSSLVAIDLARTSLITGQADQALVGGVNLILSPQGSISLSRVNALSDDGKCKVFDESANGYGRGEGCAVLVLKRLSDAQKDGDLIRAVITGSSVNHDGRSSGLTVPNGQAQESVIKDAIAQADVDINDIAYIEAHGTGTKLGDPQELNALTNVFKNRDANNPLPVGSIKSNIGHLEGAAGIAGVVKLILAMEKGIIPKSLHLNKPNTLVPWSNIPLKPLSESLIIDNSQLINCGISSFGLSGTNAHLILQNRPKIEPLANKKNINSTLIIAGKTESSLNRCKENFLELLSLKQYSALDITTASQRSYQDYPYRIAVVGPDKETLISKLEKYVSDNMPTQARESLAFVFTGQGSQYLDMAKGLYKEFRVFSEAMTECSELFHPYLNISLEELLYQGEPDRINKTLYSQPIIFSIGYALLKLLREFGVRPNYLLGHSIGQYTAAFAAGILNLSDAVHLVANRAILMNKVKMPGAMVAAFASISDIQAIIDKCSANIAVAAINSPSDVTLSGSADDIQEFIDTLKDLNIPHKRLDVSHAFHSPLMKTVLDPFGKIIDGVTLNPPKIPIVSDLTGNLAPIGEYSEITQKNYWLSHITQSIRFSDGLETLSKHKCNTYIELGGSAVLSSFITKTLRSGNESLVVSPLRGKLRCSIETLNQALADLYIHNYPVNWKAMSCKWSKTAIDLPYYCFSKTTFPIHITGPEIKAELKKELIPREVTLNNSTVDKKNIKYTLINLIEGVSGLIMDQHKKQQDFLSLGMDSLMLSQLKNKIQDVFGVDVPLMELYGQYSSVDKLHAYLSSKGASHIDQKQSLEENIEVSGDSSNKDTHDLLSRQLKTIQAVCQAQLDYLGSEKLEVGEKPEKNDSNLRVEYPKTNFRLAKFSEDELSLKQQSFVDGLIKRYNKRTAGSKDFSCKNKDDFAHYLTSLNFRKTLKEILYPLVSSEADGAYLWDIDGNRYVDLAIGYGVHFFGHKPQFVIDAVKQQMDKGFVLSPHSSLLGEVTQLIKEITATERVSYCNTGSEAVMLSLRMARTQTGRSKIVKFSGSYHGIYDGILAESDENGSYPTTPGVTMESVQDTIVLPYGDPKSLDVIKQLGTELAAVLVEPVQSRNPELQPRQFLQKLRSLTSEFGTVLIFDEIITGFRLQAGGAQAFFDIQADLVTYGKVIGGGLPIGIVAGKRRFMDVIDGGRWQYQDGSTPQTEATFIAGTFSNHPMALVAAKSVLLEIKKKGPRLYEKTNELTLLLVKRLNDYFTFNHVPIKVKSCGSIFRFESFGQYALALQPIEMDLLFYLMMLKGVYTWERRICFLSTQHTHEDIDKVYNIVCESISELRAGGFSFTTMNPPSPPNGTPTRTGCVNQQLMSSAQKRIFALNSLKGAEQAYHLSYEAEVKGSIEPAKIQRVLTLLSRRHESLRTTFKLENGEFIRIVHRELPPNLELENVTTDTLEQSRQRFFRSYDLEKDPMLRAKLITLEDEKHIFMLDIHHIAADGFSANILFQEFMIYYENLNNNSLTKPSQFEDFVEWEGNYYESDKYHEDKNYWTNQLMGYRESPELPLDYPRAKIQTFNGHTLTFMLSKERTEQLTGLAKKLNVSLYMLLLSGYILLIRSLTKSDETIVGAPVALRQRRGFENIVGMMTNTLVYRPNLQGVKTFTELAHRIKGNCIDAYAHQEYPFEKLVEQYFGTSINKRDKSRNPLFDVNFVFEQADERVLNIKGVEFVPQKIEQKGNTYDFSFEAILQHQELEINFHYNKSLFNLDTISSWKNLFLVVINNILQSPDMEIDSILPPENIEAECSKVKLHHEWSGSNSILDRFTSMVDHYPDNTAINFEKQSLSYRQLDCESNQWAHMLRQQYGLLPGDRIAVQIESGRFLISALIAVLKLGCCYIPIDPDTPEDRVDFILKDSLAKVLLSESHLPKLNFYSRCDLDRIDSTSFSNLPIEIGLNPDSIAYIIYTSGSTGRPKGVKILHSSLTNYFQWFIEKYQVCDSDSSLLLSSYAFDLGYTSLWGSILSGACLHLMRKCDRQNISFVLSYLARHQITFVKITPSLFQILVNHQDFTESLDLNLRLILLGGESIRVEDIDIYLKYFKNTVFVNHYGPTEATIGCITREFDIHTFKQYRQLKSIGQPISNCKAYILDENLEKVANGEEGELCIEGDCLAQGYLSNIDLEKEKFIHSPFTPGERLYRTGDLGYIKSDELYVSGRIDDQAKIRGYRVELGEITKVLEEHPDLKRAVVIAKESRTGNELIAYYQNKNSLLNFDLRDFVSRKLPDYMRPSHYFEVREFPINENGKLDLRELQKKGERVNTGTEVLTHSLSESQKLITATWQEMLQIPAIELNDDFFTLGGHSLKAMLIAAELSKKFSVQLSINEIFEYPTVAKLDAWLSKNNPLQPEIKPTYIQELYPLSAAQKRLWLVSQSKEQSIAYNVHAAFLLEGELCVSSLEKALSYLIQRHESLRTNFIFSKGEPQQKIHDDIDVPLTVLKPKGMIFNSNDFKELYKEISKYYFDLESDALFQVVLIELASDKSSQALIFNAHHIICDGWSNHILIKELCHLYNCFKQNKAPNLKPLEIQYKDYAIWHNRMLEGAQADKERMFWRRQLEGVVKPTQLPNANTNIQYSGEWYRTTIDENLSDAIQKFCKTNGVSLYTLMSSVTGILLSHYCGTDEVIYSSPIAARQLPQLQDQVGFYLSNIILKLNIESDLKFIDFLNKTKSHLRNVIQHQLYPVEQTLEMIDLKEGSISDFYRIILNVMEYKNYSSYKMDGLIFKETLETAVTSRADLNIMLVKGDFLELVIEYNNQLMDQNSIISFKQQLINLISIVLERSETSLSDLKMSLIGSQEKQKQAEFLDAALAIDEEF